MTWKETILKAREEAEVRTGYTPTHVVIRQEVWLELAIEGPEIYDVWELDGMQASVADYLNNPFEFLIKIDAV